MIDIRVALYARYSSDLQRDASIEDQLRLCRDHAAGQGWQVIDSYTDRGISGASLLRPGIQAILEDATRRRFDIVLAEAMDRLSRDQEDIAGLFKRLRFAGVSIVTVSEGEVGEMHIGLKGTMNALFLKDLADKTRRGLRGRVEAGKSGGGNSYGYQVVRQLGPDGSLTTGDRVIDTEQADIVRRVFHEFAHGKSPRGIAVQLNKGGIAGPRGEGWGQSTINGHAERGTGILNNELYIGRMVWNRLHYMKDPVTGKRVSRANPPDRIIRVDVPELRIIDDALWQAVKDRQALAHKATRPDMTGGNDNATRSGFWNHQRPRHMLTGLMHCGICGGSYAKISGTLFGCATARNKGTCDNRLNIRADRLDDIVLAGLKQRLMDPAIYAEFLAAYIGERNSILAHRNAHYAKAEAELTRIKARQKTLLQALVDGVPARTVRDEMIALESREDEVNALLAARPTTEPSLHPALADIYREKVTALHQALSEPATRDEAFGIIRTLIEEVQLVPEDGELKIELRGALAGILRLGAQKSRHGDAMAAGSADVLISQVKLVAGTRNRRSHYSTVAIWP